MFKMSKKAWPLAKTGYSITVPIEEDYNNSPRMIEPKLKLKVKIFCLHKVHLCAQSKLLSQLLVPNNCLRLN